MDGLSHLPAAAPQVEMFGGAPIEQRARGRGRPPGSQNLHSKMVRSWILGRHDNPLEGLVALALPADLLQIVEKARALAPGLRCTVKEAVEIMIKCSEASNRFLNAPPPLDVNVNDRRVVLAIGVGAAPTALDGQNTGLTYLRQQLLANAAKQSQEARDEADQVIDAIASIVEENDDKSTP